MVYLNKNNIKCLFKGKNTTYFTYFILIYMFICTLVVSILSLTFYHYHNKIKNLENNLKNFNISKLANNRNNMIKSNYKSTNLKNESILNNLKDFYKNFSNKIYDLKFSVFSYIKNYKILFKKLKNNKINYVENKKSLKFKKKFKHNEKYKILPYLKSFKTVNHKNEYIFCKIKINLVSKLDQLFHINFMINTDINLKENEFNVYNLKRDENNEINFNRFIYIPKSLKSIGKINAYAKTSLSDIFIKNIYSHCFTFN